MKMTRLLAAAFSSLLLPAFTCGRDYTEPDSDFGPGAGITYRDAQGKAFRFQDPTDWTSDTTWNSQELARFGTSNVPQRPGAVSYSLAYPTAPWAR